MKTIDVTKRSIGVNFKAQEATITLWAPNARSVNVIVNGREKVTLHGKEYGYWEATTSMIQAGDRYVYVLDDTKELPDPASLSQPNGVHGFSKALDLKAFQWTDHTWINPPLHSYILYELHTGTYTSEGTFEAITHTIPHLKALGITTIEIMPIAAFPGNRNWGYDGVFPFAVHDGYGGAEALQKLVNHCHQEGIAVILDVVYNHLGPEGNYLGEFGPYFTDKYKTPWGMAINVDDAGCDGVRNYFIENALMWLRDFHLDGLRLDAVHAIKDFSATHFLGQLREQVDELSVLTGKNYYLIAECDLNDPKFINPPEQQGYGMNAQWTDEFHHALRMTVGQEPTGYYSDFKGLEHLAKSYKDAYVYDGQYSKHRQKTFGLKADTNPGEQFIVFLQNHDQVGNRMLGERTSRLVSYEMQKVMAGAVLASPFIPLLFMGEEWSETNPFLYFVSHTDAELAEAVRKGRKAEFKEFHTEGEAPDPMDTETFERSKLQWKLTQQEPHATMLSYYQALIELRKNHWPLHKFKREQLEVTSDTLSQTLCLHRWSDDQHVHFWMNFSKQAQQVTLSVAEKGWKKLLYSADPEWFGETSSFPELNSGKEIMMAPESLLIFTNHV